MTIRKGSSWGEPGGLPADGVVVATDAEARAVVEVARRSGAPVPPLGLVGGDLCRTLGGSGDRSRLADPDHLRLPVDLGSVLLDGRQHWFVAHLVAHRRGWRGRAVVAMNAQFLGRWDLGPRSHPGDGLIDFSDGRLGLGDRLKARRRLPSGTHLPHPGIRTSRSPHEAFTFDPPLEVWLDGVAMGPVREAMVRVEPDALTVVV